MKFEFSAGGIVYKQDKGQIFILIAQHSQHLGWVFPKGLIGDTQKGEKKEVTAVREVKEETGIDAEIVEQLPKIEYWYRFEGEMRKKTVYYYIMKHLGGSFDEKDHEMKNVEWVNIDEVLDKLTYKSDKGVWQKAKEIIQHIAKASS